jgi:hypothetical protein
MALKEIGISFHRAGGFEMHHLRAAHVLQTSPRFSRFSPSRPDTVLV